MRAAAGFLEAAVTAAIILGAIALVYAAGRWVKRQIEGPPGDWFAANLAGLWRRLRRRAFCAHGETEPHWVTDGVPISPAGVKHPVFSWHQCPGPANR